MCAISGLKEGDLVVLRYGLAEKMFYGQDCRLNPCDVWVVDELLPANGIRVHRPASPDLPRGAWLSATIRASDANLAPATALNPYTGKPRTGS